MSRWDVIKAVTKKPDNEVKRIWEASKSIKRHQELLKVPEGSGEIVAKLSGRYKLAIVTSRVKESAKDIFRALKTGKFFGVVVSYEDTERHKPEPDHLLLAAERLGMNPEECSYIGDAETDKQAAESAGMKFIFFGRDVKSFPEIPGALESLAVS